MKVKKTQMVCILGSLRLFLTCAKHAGDQESWNEGLLSSFKTLPLIELFLYSVVLNCCQLRKIVKTKDIEKEMGAERELHYIKKSKIIT